MELVWSNPAAYDLEQIQNYIAEDNVEVAIRFTKEIFDEVESIPVQPYQGRKIPELSKDEYRELIFRKYRIMYKISESTIFILAIVNSRMSFDSIRNRIFFKQ